MVKEVEVKSILNKKRRDPWFLDDYSLNPYRGCQFNCAYCYIHGGGYSSKSGEVEVKVNAPSLLEAELRKLSRRRLFGYIALSSATEPWMKLEEQWKLTRRCLSVIERYRFPVHCLTKSTLIKRDLDLLSSIDQRSFTPSDLKETVGRGALITLSFSTLEAGDAKVFEPGAPSPKDRMELISKLSREGFMAGAAFIPVLPYISDGLEELETMIREARDCGASYVFVGSLTLQGPCRERFLKALRSRYPELEPRYMELYSSTYSPPRSYEAKLEEAARKLCDKLGVKYRIA